MSYSGGREARRDEDEELEAATLLSGEDAPHVYAHNPGKSPRREEE